jgi:hypothetical protein
MASISEEVWMVVIERGDTVEAPFNTAAIKSTA